MYALMSGNADHLAGQPGSYYVDTATSQTIAGVKNFTGNVGIGTASPMRALHITANSAEIVLESTNVTDATQVGRLWRTRSDAGSFYIEAMNGALNSGFAALVATKSGNVGIGTGGPGYKLDVQGGDINASGSVRASGVALSSDARLKSNVETLHDALADVQRLRGVRFTWKKDGRSSIGLIAQEVEKVFPELVSTGANGFKAVDYANLVGVLVEAMKQVSARQTALANDSQERIRRLENANSALRARLDRLERALPPPTAGH
jgi:hypothetical protein